MLGDNAEKRALPGARDPARPGRGSNTDMAPLYMNPRPSVTTPEGWPKVWVMVTQLPCSSTADTWVVWAALAPPALKRATVACSPRSMASALPAGTAWR